MFLKVILDRSEFFHDLVYLGEGDASYQNSATFYLLLPIKQQKCRESMIVDWATIRRCLSSPIFKHPSVSCERDLCPLRNSLKLLNGVFTENDVLNSLVFTPHNKLFYIIDGILYEMNAHNTHKAGISYEKYYKNR